LREQAASLLGVERCAKRAGALELPIMPAGMNWLDFALLIIIGLSIVHGLSHGALRMLTSILSFVLGIYGAWRWHAYAGAIAQSHLGTSPVSSDIIGYAAIFLMVFVAIELVGQRIIAFAELVHLNLIDRLAGAALGLVLGAIFAGLNIVLLTALLPANYPVLQNSEVAPKILAYDQKLMGYLPAQVKQVYQDKRDQLTHYWNAKHANPANTAQATR
jgi:membrane protein required for colicin V production